MAPQAPFTGDCDVATWTLTGKEPGVYVIAFDDVILANKEGSALPSITVNGTVTVTTTSP